MEDFFESNFSFWKYLKEDEKELIRTRIIEVHKKKGMIITHGGEECTGPIAIKKGRARAYITSLNGEEITLYRVIPGETCILSAACMIKNMNITINMEMEEDADLIIIPKCVFKQISDNNIQVKEYVLEMVSEKFSEIMGLFSQFAFSNMANRLAQKLLEHRDLEQSDILIITHDILARDLGTAREVVTRLLKQFQIEGLVELSRGKIKLLNIEKLRNL